MITKYKKLNEELESSKKEILGKAKQEALNILNESNRLIEKTIKEIRENQAEKERTKEVREEIRDLKLKIEKDTQKDDKQDLKVKKTCHVQYPGKEQYTFPGSLPVIL